MLKNHKQTPDFNPRRYFANTKETLSKSDIEYGHYTDSKYVSEASGIAYLAAIDAIVNYAKEKGIFLKSRPKSYEGMSHLIDKFPQKNKLHYKFKTVYELLHSGAYYNRFTDANVIKRGFKTVEEIIEMLD